MNSNHIIRRVAVALLAGALAIILAAPAQADSRARPDDQAIHGPGAVAAIASADPVRPDDRADRTVVRAEQPSAARPDDRAFRGIGPVLVVSPTRPDDRADRQLPTVAVEALPTTDDGFDWTDAGIGAVGAFGLALLLAGASVLGLRHRRAAALS
jgi:hypothetical protein